MSDFDPEFKSPADHARELRKYGLQVVPALSPKAGAQWKRPAIKWREHETALADDRTFNGWFTGYRGANIGILTGNCSGRLLVIDLDTHKGPEANDWYNTQLTVHNNGMELETVEQMTGGGGRQLFFFYPVWWKAPTCKFPVIHVDIRGEGGFVVCAPSMHESGTPYQWVYGKEPWSMEISMAPDWLLAAIDALVAKYGGRAPQNAVHGHQSVLRTETPEYPRTLSGRLRDGREGYMTALIWATCVELRADSPIKAHFREEQDEAFRHYVDGVAPRVKGPGTDEQRLEAEGRGRTLFDIKWTYALDQWDTNLMEAASSRPKQPEPFQVEYHDPTTGEIIEVSEADPAPPEAQHNVFDPWAHNPTPDFPLDTLPPKVRQFVRTVALSTGGDINAVAMCALATAASAIDQQFRLRMKRTGGWLVPPRLWVMLNGDPSSKKSPIMQECLKPLQAVEREVDKRYAREHAKWKATAKESGDPPPPKPPRYTTNSITTEKLGDILSRQDRGICVAQDELSGWIGSMDAYRSKGSEADKAFWATAYNGHRFKIDRVTRGEVIVENLICNIIGGIQPNTIKKFGDLTDNGLLQRFLIVLMRQGELSQEVEDDMAYIQWDALIRRLTTIQPNTLTASQEALEAFSEFQVRSNSLQRMQALGGAFTTFVGKLDGVMGSLALILHLMHGGHAEPVTGEAAHAAKRIVDEFIIPHAHAFHSEATAKGEWDELRALAGYILTSDKLRFTPSDITTNVRSTRGMSSWDIAQKVSPLVAAGWLDEDRAKGGVLKGWVMVEGVREVLDSRRQEQAARRREAFEVLAALKQAKSEGDSKS
jgi:hypothetical protein